MIRVSYSDTVSSLISPGGINTGAIHSSATVRMSLRNVGYLDRSSFLCGGYENLFIDSEYPTSQSLLLPAGRYIIDCMVGTITVAFSGLVAGPFSPTRLVVDVETEVFFLFSSDCDSPSLYKSEFILPYAIGLAKPNIVELPVSTLNGQLGVSLSYTGLTRAGWFESTYLMNVDAVSLETIDMSTIAKSTVAAYYTDVNNYLALYILPNFLTVMYGKVAGIEVRNVLGSFTPNTGTISFIITGTTVTISIQDTVSSIEVPGITVPFETAYIGYDGVDTYLNNRITGVAL